MQSPKNRVVINHLFILDESASMQSIMHMALSSFNDTLLSIQQDAHCNGSDHRFTFLTFNGGGVKQHCFDRPINEIDLLKSDQYSPYGSSPLMDCVGLGIGLVQVALKQQTDDGRVMVTIVTDGDENGSTKYCTRSISSMIRRLKNSGWIFNYIGANHNVEARCKSLGIDNYYVFKKLGHLRRRKMIIERMALKAYNDSLLCAKEAVSFQAA